MSQVPMTIQGAELLRKELEHLKKTERPQVIKAIAEARAHGDLKENAEYHAAREQQGFIESRIRDLEYKLSHASIIDLAGMAPSGRVVFGSTVSIMNLGTDEQQRFRIVGEDEADIKKQKISFSSPMARALIGKSVEDVVVVSTPSGNVEYEIVGVTYE